MEVEHLKKLSWYISLGITLAGFMIINYFFTLDKGEKIGNINPAFIPIVILIPFLFLSVFITFSVGASYFNKATTKKVITAIALMLLIFFLAGSSEYTYVKDQLELLGGNWNDKKSVIYGLSAFNSYTNDWYFNESVFLILHTVAFALGSIGKKNEENSGEEK